MQVLPGGGKGCARHKRQLNCITLAITRESGRTVLVRLGPGVSFVVGNISLKN